MALSEDKSAPYAPTSAIASILERNRGTGLPSPINKDTLSRLGVSDSLNARTLQALHVLDLIDDEGGHTDTLKSLRTAKEGEYKARLGEWLNAAYADILQYVDPASGDEVAVMDAFRPYKPSSMIGRMVTLFTGLYGIAGIWPEDAQRARVTPTPSSKPRVSTSPAASAERPKKAPAAPSPEPISEKALEYRLVDLMSEAVSDPEVMTAIVTIITFLKTKEANAKKNGQKEG